MSNALFSLADLSADKSDRQKICVGRHVCSINRRITVAALSMSLFMSADVFLVSVDEFGPTDRPDKFSLADTKKNVGRQSANMNSLVDKAATYNANLWADMSTYNFCRSDLF